MTRIIGGQEAEVNEWPWQVVFVKSGMVMMMIVVKVMTIMRRRVEISNPVEKKLLKQILKHSINLKNICKKISKRKTPKIPVFLRKFHNCNHVNILTNIVSGEGGKGECC